METDENKVKVPLETWMQAILTLVALIIAGVLWFQQGDVPDWLIAIVSGAFFYWFPSNKQLPRDK